MRKWLAIACGVTCLVLINFSIWQKEQQIAHGRQVLLELAPVDPRSLMQGDYMVLNYSMQNDLRRNLYQDQQWQEKDGFVIVQLDEHQVGHYVDLDHGQALAENQVRLQYRVRNHSVQFASNAFFFEEGSGKVFEQAKYGEFRVADNGSLLLTNLYDANYHVITAQTKQ